MNKDEIADLILKFIDDAEDLGKWEWDDFTTIRAKDPAVEAIRLAVLEIEQRFPPESNRGWCSEEGIHEMRKIAMELKKQP